VNFLFGRTASSLTGLLPLSPRSPFTVLLQHPFFVFRFSLTALLPEVRVSDLLLFPLSSVALRRLLHVVLYSLTVC